MLRTETTPGAAEGAAPGGWQGEASASVFAPGVLGSVIAATIAKRIYADVTDSVGNPFPDGLAVVRVGETPNIIAELTTSSGSLTIVTTPTVAVFSISDGSSPPNYSGPANVQAADAGTQPTVRALAQVDTSAFVAGNYHVFVTTQVSNANGQIETITLCLMLVVQDLAA